MIFLPIRQKNTKYEKEQLKGSIVKRELGNKKFFSIVNSKLPNKLITQLPF